MYFPFICLFPSINFFSNSPVSHRTVNIRLVFWVDKQSKKIHSLKKLCLLWMRKKPFSGNCFLLYLSLACINLMCCVRSRLHVRRAMEICVCTIKIKSFPFFCCAMCLFHLPSATNQTHSIVCVLRILFCLHLHVPFLFSWYTRRVPFCP